MIELQAKANDWEAVVTAKRALIDVADEEERFRLLDECGDIYREQLNNTAEGDRRLPARPSSLQPESHVVLHKLLELYTETKQWKKAVDDGRSSLTEIEKRLRGCKAKYFYTAAVIYRDEMRALDEAVDFFNRRSMSAPTCSRPSRPSTASARRRRTGRPWSATTAR